MGVKWLSIPTFSTPDTMDNRPWKIKTNKWGPFLPLMSKGHLMIEASPSQTHHTPQDFFGQVISPMQRPLPDSTQHSLQTDIIANGGFRTHISSKPAASDPHLRPLGHRCRQQGRCANGTDGGRVMSTYVESIWQWKRGCLNYTDPAYYTHVMYTAIPV
jgi:hypothetical protein